MKVWQDTAAEGLLYLAVVVIGLTAADTVVYRVSTDLARLIPSYEPILSMAVLVSSVVTALILTSLWLKTWATRRRVMARRDTLARELSLPLQRRKIASCSGWKRHPRESAQ